MQRRFPACSIVLKKSVEQSLIILDFKGYEITRLFEKTKAFLQIALSFGQDYYPEMLGKMMLLNTSLLFNAVWVIVKAFIDEKTRKKIHMLGNKYQSKLLEMVDKENLPCIIGETYTCSHIENGCCGIQEGCCCIVVVVSLSLIMKLLLKNFTCQIIKNFLYMYIYVFICYYFY